MGSNLDYLLKFLYFKIAIICLSSAAFLSFVINLPVFWLFKWTSDVDNGSDVAGYVKSNINLICDPDFGLYALNLPFILIRFLLPMTILIMTSTLIIRKVKCLFT